MDPVTAVVTGLGLAGAAGLNAYVPLLVVGLLERADVVSLPAPYDSLSEPAVLVILGVLLAIEFFADKIPGVDSLNDIVQTVVRPLAGAVLMAGSLGIGTDLPPWVGVLAGIITAGGIHATKAVARPAINVSTGGVGGPVVSVVEDVVSFIASLLAVLAPVLLVVFVVGLVWWVWRTWSRRRAAKALTASGRSSGVPGGSAPGLPPGGDGRGSL